MHVRVCERALGLGITPLVVGCPGRIARRRPQPACIQVAGPGPWPGAPTEQFGL